MSNWRANDDGSTTPQHAPTMDRGGNLSAQTSAGGIAFVAFAAQPCLQITLCNRSGVDVEVQQDGAGTAFPVLNNSYFSFYGIKDAGQLAVRRVDQSAVQATVSARWEA